MLDQDKIFVAGHNGLVGSAIARALKAQGFHNLLLKPRVQLDLTRQQQVDDFFAVEKPDYVFLAAAKVGGIHANNQYRADFISQNLAIQNNVLQSAYENQVKRLLFLGSSCIYPRDCPQPMLETHLLTGPLEQTNEPYAIAKIAGVKTCESFNTQYGTEFIPVMPTNLYGVQDNFDLENSHVLPALIRKAHEAKLANQTSLEVWGTGKPKREFLFADDLADACVFIMKNAKDSSLINIGSGHEVSIAELAKTVCDVVGYKGQLVFDTSKPDGTPRKLLDSTKLDKMGWQAKTSLIDGITQMYNWYCEWASTQQAHTDKVA